MHLFTESLILQHKPFFWTQDCSPRHRTPCRFLALSTCKISHHSLHFFLRLLLLFMLYLSETRNLLEISVNTEVVRAPSSAWRAIWDEKTKGLLLSLYRKYMSHWPGVSKKLFCYFWVSRSFQISPVTFCGAISGNFLANTAEYPHTVNGIKICITTCSNKPMRVPDL